MAKPMMKCGHAANATSDGKPVCAICAPVNGWNEIDYSPDSLEGRLARCTYYGYPSHGRDFGPIYGGCNCEKGKVCKCETASDSELPFFEHRPGADFDSFFCGCKGWN